MLRRLDLLVLCIAVFRLAIRSTDASSQLEASSLSSSARSKPKPVRGTSTVPLDDTAEEMPKSIPKAIQGHFLKVTELDYRMDDEFEPLDKNHPSEPLPSAFRLKSTEELGTRATGSILPKDALTDLEYAVASGDRVITTKHTWSMIDGNICNQIDVYDIMTGTVMFSVKHFSTYPFRLFATSRLLVIVEESESGTTRRRSASSESILTVYELGDDGVLLESDFSAKRLFGNVLISRDNSMVAFCKRTTGAFIFVKEEGYFNIKQGTVYLGDKWFAYRVKSSYKHRRNIIAVNTSTRTAKRLFDNLNVVLTLSGTLLTWAKHEKKGGYIVQMADLSREMPAVHTLGVLPQSHFHDSHVQICPFGDFDKTRMLIVVGGYGAVALINVDAQDYAIACQVQTTKFETVVRHDSPLVLRLGPRDDNSTTFDVISVIRLRSSLTPESVGGPTWHAMVCEMFRQKIMTLDSLQESILPSEPARSERDTEHLEEGIDERLLMLARIVLTFLQYLPKPKAFFRWTILPIGGRMRYAFDASLRYRYALEANLDVHQETACHGYRRHSISFPNPLIRGDVQQFRVNSDGTVFYLATKIPPRSKYLAAMQGVEDDHAEATRWFVYAIDAKHRTVHECRLSRFIRYPDVVQIEPFDDRVLAVTLRSTQTLILACKDRRSLLLLRILAPGQRLRAANRHVAIIEDFGGKRLSSLNLTKKRPALKRLEVLKGSRFAALKKNTLYLLSRAVPDDDGQEATSRNTKSLRIVYIQQKRDQLKGFISSQVHSGGTIRFIDSEYCYRVYAVKDSCLLRSIPLPGLPNEIVHVSVSPEGYRVLLYTRRAIHAFDMVDMGLSPKALKKSKRSAKSLQKKQS